MPTLNVHVQCNDHLLITQCDLETSCLPSMYLQPDKLTNDNRLTKNQLAHLINFRDHLLQLLLCW